MGTGEMRGLVVGGGSIIIVASGIVVSIRFILYHSILSE